MAEYDDVAFGAMNAADPEKNITGGAITYSEFEEKISEETMGNKDEYHRILDGGRC